jgi:hypothetical protein
MNTLEGILAVMFRHAAEERVRASDKYAQLVDEEVNRLKNSKTGSAHLRKVYSAYQQLNEAEEAAARSKKRK